MKSVLPSEGAIGSSWSSWGGERGVALVHLCQRVQGAGTGGPLLNPWWVMDGFRGTGPGRPGRDHCLANEARLSRRGSPICWYCLPRQPQEFLPPTQPPNMCAGRLSFLRGDAPETGSASWLQVLLSLFFS